MNPARKPASRQLRRLPDAIGLQTERLMLRQWLESDRDQWAAMNADPAVREYFPGLLSRAQSNAALDRFRAGLAAAGWGSWALEVRASGEFIGFAGLGVPNFEAAFTPAVEVGWRLARAAWGKGYATEAARAALDFGFDGLGLPEIVSFTTAMNHRSRAVMRRLGMTHDPVDDFDHPQLAADNPLRRHVLYRLRAGDHQVGAVSHDDGAAASC